MAHRILIAALAALTTLAVATNADATCPCPEVPNEVKWGGVGFAESNAAFWGIVRAIDYRPNGTFAEVEVRRTYTPAPVEDTAQIVLNTLPCAPEVRLGVGFLTVSYMQVEGAYHVENCVYSALEPFERPSITARGVQNLDAVREVLEPALRKAITEAVVECQEPNEPLPTFGLSLDFFTDDSWDFELIGIAKACTHERLLDELEVPEHDQYPVSVKVQVTAGQPGDFELSGIPFAEDSESVLRAALLTDADEVAPSARLLRASRQLKSGKTWEAVFNVCIADGLAKAEALLDVYKPTDRTVADLFACAAHRDDVSGMLRVLGEATHEERMLRQVLERLSKRDLSIRPIADTGPMTQSKAERLAILSWARRTTDWVHSAVLLEIVAEATNPPSGVAGLALHRASLLRPQDEERFRSRSAQAAPTGELDPRLRHRLTAKFARAEERRRKVELTASEALAAARTQPTEQPDLGVDMSPEVMEPQAVPEEPEVEEIERSEPLAIPAWCGLFGLFALLVLANVVRRGLTSPS